MFLLKIRFVFVNYFLFCFKILTRNVIIYVRICYTRQSPPHIGGIIMNYQDNYGFFYKAKQTVYKWWCVVYRPAYKLFHQGYWPAEKEPYYAMNQAKEKEEQAARLAQVANVDAEDLANSILSSKQGNIDTMVANTTPTSEDVKPVNTPETEPEPEIDLSQVDPDALARANEIMARLASEAAADEAKKQAEIDAAKAKAKADEEAAKAKAAEDEAKRQAEQDAAKARADEIIARLANEAAEDEAKKQAEIDAAKAKAAEDARLESILKSTKVDISAFIEEGKAQSNENARLESILQSTKVDISAYIEEGKAHRNDS